MFKNSILYRRIWYIKRRRKGRLRLLTVTFCILIILTSIIQYSESRIYPMISDMVDRDISAAVSIAVRKAAEEIYEERSGGKAGLAGNGNGYVEGLEMLEGEQWQLYVPVGIFLGDTRFAGFGPNINVGKAKLNSIETMGDKNMHGAGIKVNLTLSVFTKIFNRELIVEIPQHIKLHENVGDCTEV